MKVGQQYNNIMAIMDVEKENFPYLDLLALLENYDSDAIDYFDITQEAKKYINKVTKQPEPGDESFSIDRDIIFDIIEKIATGKIEVDNSSVKYICEYIHTNPIMKTFISPIRTLNNFHFRNLIYIRLKDDKSYAATSFSYTSITNLNERERLLKKHEFSTSALDDIIINMVIKHHHIFVYLDQ